MTRDDRMPHLTDDQLVLHHYGEDTDEQQREAGAHLAQCAECREALDRLRHVLGLVTADADPQAPDGFERVMWARVQPLIESRRSRQGGWASWLGLRGLALAGGLAALVIAAFVAGRWSGAPGWRRRRNPWRRRRPGPPATRGPRACCWLRWGITSTDRRW